MRNILVNSLCILGSNLWALDASAVAPAPAAPVAASPVAIIQTCALDPKLIAAAAARKGYVSTATSTPAEGGPDCSIDSTGTILIVSASAVAAGTCTFSIFAPPARKRLTVVRIAVKAASDGSTRYIQRGEDLLQGLSVTLSARKGQTVQFRITGVEVDPVNNQCLAPNLENAL